MLNPDLRAGGMGGGQLPIVEYKQRAPLRIIHSGIEGVSHETQTVVFQAEGIPPENRTAQGDYIYAAPAPTQL